MSAVRIVVRAAVLLAALVGASPEPSRAEESKEFRVLARDEHIVVVAHRTAIEAGLADVALAREVRGWAAATRRVYVDDLGMRPPASEGAGGRTVFVLQSFAGGRKDHAVGFCTSAGRIYLDARRLRQRLPDALGGAPLASFAVAHEMFHAVHRQYDPDEDRWLREATANWAASIAQPAAQALVVQERKFLAFPELSLHGHAPLGEGAPGESVHPYGAALFFRFLGEQLPQNRRRGFLRALWEECARRPGPSSLEALSRSLGDERPLGPAFRRWYDAFAMACLLRHRAPPAWRLPKPENYRKNVPPFLELGPSVARVLAAQTKDPPGSLPAEAKVSLGGVAARYVCLLRPEEIPPRLPASVGLTISVAAKEGEISLQAAVARQEWAVVAGAYDAATGTHRLSIPAVAEATRPVVVCLVRYAESTKPTSYVVSVSAQSEEVWEVDLEFTKAEAKKVPPPAPKPEDKDDMFGIGEGVGAGLDAAMTKLMEAMMRSTLTFRPDGTFELDLTIAKLSGTWTREGPAGAYLVHARPFGGKPDAKAEILPVELKEGRLGVPFGDKTKIYFRPRR